MGFTERSIKYFIATQTDEKLRRENIKGKYKANEVHYKVGVKVRKTIEELGGSMPEDLPTPKKRVKAIEKEEQKKLKIETKNKFFIIEENVKMSEVLLDFAKPLLEHCKDIEEYHKAISYATLIWNLTNLPKVDEEKFKKDIYKMFEHDEILLQDGMEIMEMMLARKDKYFKNVKKMIVDYDISVIGGQMNVQVASTPI